MTPRLAPGRGRFGVLGVPTSAGTHHAGQDRAPAALRAKGFVTRLRELGVDVRDDGDIAGEVFRVDAEHPAARNLAAVLRVARRTADAVEECAREGRVPIVLGGDCTLTLGVLAGVQRRYPDAGVLYFDGDADLALPGKGTGILDAMGISHLLGREGVTELATLFTPLPPERLALIGYDASDAETADGAFLEATPNLFRVTDADLRDDPRGHAERAVAHVGGHSGAVVLHLDVDAVDSGDLPLANFPHYGTGVPLETAQTVLATLAEAGNLAAVVLTEVNPSHDPCGESLTRYVEAVTTALAAGLGGSTVS
jgi:arginase